MRGIIPQAESSHATALRIAAMYAFLGATWVLFSDQLLTAFAADAATIARIQLLKGWVFVALSAVVLYILVERSVAARRASEARLQAVLQSAPVVLWATDRDGVFTLSEGRGLEGMGRSAGQSVGHSLYELYAEVPEIVEAHRRALAGESFVITVEVQGRVFESFYAPIRRRGEVVGVTGVATDITQRTELEERLHHSQKMEAIGRLAGGVAHDFNNVLTAISGHAELLLDDLDPVDPKHDDVQEIKKAADRAAGLTRQLLAFSRQQPLETQVLDVNDVVSGLEKMLRRLLGPDVEVEAALAAELGRIKADLSQIEQVIVNLAVNARDAMPEGGKLSIETANVDLDQVHAQNHDVVQPGPYVLLAVSDTGRGMDRATQARIFEPFFTTKPKERGTGLGLSTVYGIVKQSGGYISVYSEPDLGTSFKIYLPRVPDARAAALEPAVTVEVHGGAETVLLVEDDPAVRALAARVLREHGYAVLEAETGHDALALVEEAENGIDLLLTDAVLPWYSGRELTRRVRALRPAIKVLYVSGYTAFATVRHGMLEPDVAFLPKPFTPVALARKVREVLDRP